MRKIVVDERYAWLREFVESLPESLDGLPNSKILHKGRNELRYVEVDGRRLVVKSYTHLSPINRLVYGRFRRSKAMRAYRYAQRLLDMGIDTPQPVAAKDVYKRGVLRQSLFVSEYSDYRSAAVANEYPLMAGELQPFMDALAEFIYRLHNVGILHQDLNITNILYRHTPNGEYRFQLIDINRMVFRHRISKQERAQNLRRLSCSAAAYVYILEKYAELLASDESSFQLRGLIARLLFERRQQVKQNIKMML